MSFRHLGFALLALLSLPIAARAERDAATIENEFLTVALKDGRVSLSSKVLKRLVVPALELPAKLEGSAIRSCRDPIWGDGQELLLTHVTGWATSIRLFAEHPFAHLHTTAGNRTDKPALMNQAPLFSYDVDLGIPIEQIRTLGTGGLGGMQAEGSYSWSVVADPSSRHGVVAGCLTHETGVGAFFPRRLPGQERGRVSIRSDFGQFRVMPGKPRPIDTVVLGAFADARRGLEAYADAVARHYQIELKPTPGVYCTWYHSRGSDEANLAANTAFAAEHLKPFGLTVMQIDDEWQAILPRDFQHEGEIQTTGPIKVFVDANTNYPRGMAAAAENITTHGMVAGIWFMPFAGNFQNPYFDHKVFASNPDGTPFHDRRWSGTCLDLSHPKAQALVAETVRRIHGWGYRYFKLDGLHTGAPSKNIYVNTGYQEGSFADSRLHDPDSTHLAAYRRGLQIVRANAADTFILGCNVSQNMYSMGPAFGLVDAMRIGPDNGNAATGNWRQVVTGAWHGTNLYFLNGRVWHNDPDPVYVRPSIPLESARWMCSWLAVAGGMHSSSIQYAELPAERLDLLKRCLPSHNRPARPVDLLETNEPRIWLTGNQRLSVIGLFNWQDEAEEEIVYEMGRLGLDPDVRYAAFDYWREQFVEPFSGTLQQTLPGGTCRVLAVRPVADHPQVLSTSRHITQGLIDVVAETWDSTTRTLSGRSLVVAGDPYEIRIALPATGTWKISQATLDGKAVEPGTAKHLGVRVRFQPERTDLVDWQIRF
ncbi:MAG: hypothetical protein O3C39_01130 [Planctomycetota bacterium]|jgi:hypothetical protein|nr:hypothetical protein [Planctomycetota bacterium]